MEQSKIESNQKKKQIKNRIRARVVRGDEDELELSHDI